MPNPNIGRYAKKAGKASGAARRKLKPDEIREALGDLKTVEDATRWRQRIVYWMTEGKMPTGYSGAIAQLINGFIRDLELAYDRDQIERLVKENDRLTARVKQLETENARLRGETGLKAAR